MSLYNNVWEMFVLQAYDGMIIGEHSRDSDLDVSQEYYDWTV